ncbi:MAG: hypothetical protein M4579_005595 [Chaenotheca gracillima]|nr:MAG: hypothetical protein M4579_005595 [Chaenotheca gracillima]
MYDLFRESILGQITHAVSKGKLCTTAEQRDPSLLQKYAKQGSASASGISIPATTDAVESDTSDAPQGTKADPEKGRDFQLVEWMEGDPEYPRNWSTGKKSFVTFQICLLSTSVYIGSAIYTAGIQGVAEQFHVSEVAALLGLTTFIMGYAVGPMVLSPLSEVSFFGRNPIYIGTLLIFVVLQLGVIYAKNFGMLLVFRFFSGFFGSPALATGGATIADMYTPKKQAYGIAVWDVSTVCGPALGPLVGGFAAENKGWTWTIWELMWLSGFSLVFLAFCLPETSSRNILYRRTKRYRRVTKNSNLQCRPEIEAEGLTSHEILQMTLVRPITLSFTEPIVFCLNLYAALIYALLYLWFESFPIVFGGIYHFTLGAQGLAFLGILIGSISAMFPFFWWNHKYLEPHFNENDEIKPEYRLAPALVGAFFIPICLFWFGWSARPSIHWIMPIIGSSFFSIGAFLLYISVLNYLGDAYPKYVASVLAGNDLVRSVFGAAFPLFGNAMYGRLGVAWASSLLGFLAIAFIPIPFVLNRYGEALRRRSKMARHDL